MSIPRQGRTLERATLPILRYCIGIPCVGQFAPLTPSAHSLVLFRFSLLCLFFVYAAKVLLFFDMCKFLVQKNVFFVSFSKISGSPCRIGKLDILFAQSYNEECLSAL